MVEGGVTRGFETGWLAKASSPFARPFARLAREGRPSLDDAIAHADGPSRRRFSKFERCVPERLLLSLLVEQTLDLDGARRVVAPNVQRRKHRGARS